MTSNNSPYVARRPVSACVTVASAVVSSAIGTSQSLDAAWSNMLRALAPAVRIGIKVLPVVTDPAVRYSLNKGE